MPSEMDFWPADIGETSMVPPVALMREQAALLGQKTKQLVRARVTSHADGGQLYHTFQLTAPALDYQLELFVVRHSLNLYPLYLYWKGQDHQANTQDQFLQALKGVLQSPDTKNAVHSLLAQVKSEAPSKEPEITDEDIPF